MEIYQFIGRNLEIEKQISLDVQDQGASIVGFWREPSFSTFHCILTRPREEGGSKLFCDSSQGPNPIREGSNLMTSSHSNYLPNAPPSNTITVGF